MAKHRDKPKYSKLVIVVCLAAILSYTATCFVFLWSGKPVNDFLTAFFFACFGMEFGSLAFIKGSEIKWASGNAANKQPGHVEVIEQTEGNDNEQVF